jgi:large subunit ribosomal protein L9
MQVILLERVAKLGQMGEVVKVKDGYARNFLLPQGKALRASDANIKSFESQKAQLETRNLETKKEAASLAEKLDGQKFVVIRSASDAGALYGSVTPRDAADAATAAGFSVDRKQVVLIAPIKELGLHDVKVVLHPEVSATITMNVARSAEEAELQASGKSIQRTGRRGRSRCRIRDRRTVRRHGRSSLRRIINPAKGLMNRARATRRGFHLRCHHLRRHHLRGGPIPEQPRTVLRSHPPLSQKSTPPDHTPSFCSAAVANLLPPIHFLLPNIPAGGFPPQGPRYPRDCFTSQPPPPANLTHPSGRTCEPLHGRAPPTRPCICPPDLPPPRFYPVMGRSLASALGPL